MELFYYSGLKITFLFLLLLVGFLLGEICIVQTFNFTKLETSRPGAQTSALSLSYHPATTQGSRALLTPLPDILLTPI